MNNTLTEEKFLENVKDHVMTILKDDGLYRHIQFQRKDSRSLAFELVTWPDYLSYSGDMGNYVFCRTPDMFNFFTTKDINTYYWAEKVTAESVFGNGIREFSVENFRENILQTIRENLNLEEGEPIPEDALNEVRSLLHCEDEYECVATFREYQDDPSSQFSFQDFWQCSCQEKTYYFIWCCYAIRWGVEQYNKEIEKRQALPVGEKI
jgi:hypothetical protein